VAWWENVKNPVFQDYYKKEVEMALFTNLIYIVGLLCAVWVIYDVFAKNNKLKTGMKVLWTVLALFFSIITAIVYYFVYKK